MSLCEACRKALPNIPASGGNEDSIAATYKILSEQGDWHRRINQRGNEEWCLIDPFPLHTSWESLVLSLSDDCPICWTLWRNIRSSPIASPNKESIIDFKAQISDIRHHPELHQCYVRIHLTGHQLKKEKLRFTLSKTTENDYLEAEREFPLAIQHTPKSAADVANRWIKTCEATHSQCLKPAAPPEHAKMPTRLLDLGNGNSNTWRLYQDPEHVPYAALSHRWSSDTPELHASNYQNYCNFQLDSALPQNYQDIISICRAIPIQYLWIDSLCIIQDDNGHEFSKEALLMRDIYQYAFLTLSICWDFHGQSIFRRCQPRTILRPLPLACYRKDVSVLESDVWVFAVEPELEELLVHVSEAPINQRAWVLQERCLSRRLLYLGNDQLYWECDGCTGSEVSPNSIDKDGGRQSILDLTGGDRDAAWGQTLTQYTRSDLTFENDRLIAIAGLAKLIASKTGDTYFAGIWLESWMQGLLWEPCGKERDRSLKLKPGERIMVRPSWSWLGFPGSVFSGFMMCGEGPTISTVSPNSFQSELYQLLALLSQAAVIPPKSDPSFSFERAILKIRCLLLPAAFTGTPWRDGQPWFFRHNSDINLISVGLDSFQLQACKPYENPYVTFRFYFSRPIDTSLRYFLLPLYFRRSLTGREKGYGLVLQKHSGCGDREFIRVGIWAEDYIYSSQLSPIISNTIVKLGLGKIATFGDESLTENERVFDLKIGEYAAGHVDSKVMFPLKVVKRVVEHQSNAKDLDGKNGIPGSEATVQEVNEAEEEEGPFVHNEEVECSLLPHFTTAKWGTISLV
ncbi:related to tol protein [Fusarium fujikuroi]|nr:related to tol protein [Fusarium fujikuroi]